MKARLTLTSILSGGAAKRFVVTTGRSSYRVSYWAALDLWEITNQAGREIELNSPSGKAIRKACRACEREHLENS